MSAVLILLGWLAALVIAVVVYGTKLALEKEYPYWAPRVSATFIRLAASLVPSGTRPARLQEWLGELDVLQTQGLHGLLFSLRVLVRGPMQAIADRRLESSGIVVASGPPNTSDSGKTVSKRLIEPHGGTEMKLGPRPIFDGTGRLGRRRWGALEHADPEDRV